MLVQGRAAASIERRNVIIMILAILVAATGTVAYESVKRPGVEQSPELTPLSSGDRTASKPSEEAANAAKEIVVVPENVGVKIGWAEADITPDGPALVGGQFHARISEGVKDPLKATVLVMEPVNQADSPGHVVMVTCDLGTISNELRDMVRERFSSATGVRPENIIIGATHTHAAPDPRLLPYGMRGLSDAYPYWKKLLGSRYTDGQARFGVWPCIGLEVTPPADYIEFAADRIADAVQRAWATREVGGIAYGLGHAVVARNRRLTYEDGATIMYGKAGVPEFRYVEGYEDHSVYAMMTYDPKGALTGMIVNVACPAQVDEWSFQISADYWHETRVELRKRFGKDLHILAQCAPAGDLSPHVLIGKRAEKRMWRLKGLDAGQNAPREEIAQKLANAVSDIVPYAAKEIDWTPQFEHTVEILDLPRRLISQKDVDEAMEESRPHREKFETLMDEIDAHPEIRRKHRWYMDVTAAYRRMERGERVKKRFELQQESPMLPTEIHVVRLGEIVFATSPFELYLDYAIQIRERSEAVQTFLIQKAGCSGTYLPTERSVAHKGYGAVPASTDVGPEGGAILVERTVAIIEESFTSGPEEPADEVSRNSHH